MNETINLNIGIEVHIMINSMTGFGRCESSDGDRKFTVEMKGVNHRYLDVNIRMPKKFNLFETAIRNLLKQSIQRGKVDIFVTYEDLSENQASLKYNEQLAGEYLSYFRQMEEKFSLGNDVRVSTLLRCPEVLIMEEQTMDEDELWNGLKKALSGAIRQFVETRAQEGDSLKEDILKKLSGIQKLVDYIEERSPQIVAEYREKLQNKVRELLSDTQIEEGRLAAEVVIFADKICTDEELVRLRSHVVHMKETLESKESGIGRKLDFIAQEMNREANTILSKANDLEVSNAGIDLKTEIEKVREQIQNIE
jgi:TIGR00255 family protein